VVELQFNMGRYSNARTFTVPAGGNRVFEVPGKVPLSVSAQGRSANASINVIAHPCPVYEWAQPEYQLTQATTTSSDFSATVMDYLPASANRLSVRARSSSTTSDVTLRVLGEDVDGNDYDIGLVELGPGQIGLTGSTAAVTTPTALATNLGNYDEVELASWRQTAGTGGPFTVTFYAQPLGYSTKWVKIAEQTLSATGQIGERDMVSFGSYSAYQNIGYTISGTFGGDRIDIAAYGRRSGDIQTTSGVASSRIVIDLVPGWVRRVKLTSNGIGSGETLTVDAASYRK
tara:strand:- start:794 stop:1657 length:864 start_codon:yes stop_codon:yes gene_type:complete